MGTVDIDRTVEEVLESENLLWDGENPSYDELEKLVREVVIYVTQLHYKFNDGEIDDWQVFESDVIGKCNEKIENYGT